MANNKIHGDTGEQDVAELVPCPNCAKRLMLLPPGYPLYDVQCTGCLFRAQVKTNHSKPKDVIFGAGWDIMEKVLKSGYLVPPLIANFKWSDREGTHQAILFYPFVSRKNLYKYTLAETAQRSGYPMFRYIDLRALPHFVLYQNNTSCTNRTDEPEG